MTYQNRIILDCIKSYLRRNGIMINDKDQLQEMIMRNIRRLNHGDKIAVDIDSFGVVLSVRRITGLDCLHDVDESSILISFNELEEYFNDQNRVFF
jgi:hypothetical protein